MFYYRARYAFGLEISVIIAMMIWSHVKYDQSSAI